MKTYMLNYIKTYENHFNNEKRNNTTFEAVEYAGWLLDSKYPEFTKDASYYKALYTKCKNYLSTEM